MSLDELLLLEKLLLHPGGPEGFWRQWTCTPGVGERCPSKCPSSNHIT